MITRFFKLKQHSLHKNKLGLVKPISEAKKDYRVKKKEKKSFWFEYAEKKGVNPHSSAWEEFSRKENEKMRKKEFKSLRFCTQCGGELKRDSTFCQRCGHRVKRG